MDSAVTITTTPRTILIVDDNHDAADTLAMLVRLKGHRAVVAYDAMTGLELAKRLTPDIVVHDIGMPFIDGFEAAQEFRSDPAFENTLLVALTAYDGAAESRRAEQAGFDVYLVKPINGVQLDEVLNSRSRSSIHNDRTVDNIFPPQ
jgi:two-component system CheB/CheR fusion protein